MKQSVDQSVRIGKIILFVVLGYLAFIALAGFLLPFLPLAVIAVFIGLTMKYHPWRNWLFSVDRSIRTGDIILFVVLGFLAFMFVGIVLFPSPYPPHSQAGGMGEIMTIFFSSPIAAVAVIIGLIKYRLWRNWLFWILLICSAFAVFTRALIPNSFSEGGVRNARIEAALLAPLVAVPLWQLIMALFLNAKKLKG